MDVMSHLQSPLLEVVFCVVSREKELARDRERRQELERARDRERDSRARPRDYDRKGDRGDERRRDRSPVGIRGRY